MNLAHIWYKEDERNLVRTLIESQEPSWYLESIREYEVSNLATILDILNAGYTAILVHLSFPFCLALKMAEICHRDSNPTKVILFSRTRADHTLLSGFFDGVIHRDDDISHLIQRMRAIVDEERNVIQDDEELNRRIVAIFNRSSSLKSHYRMVSGRRHQESFDLDDYRAAIEASIQRGVRRVTRYQTQDITTQATVPPSVSGDELLSLQRQLDRARKNLFLIQERKTEYMFSTDIPLQLIQEEQRLLHRIAELEQRIAARPTTET